MILNNIAEPESILFKSNRPEVTPVYENLKTVSQLALK